MAFTQNCSIFAAVGEAGINIAIQDLMAQRPALFNYATSAFQQPNTPLCNPIPAVPDVQKYGNPLFSLLALPALGPLGHLDVCVQITALVIDFFPNNSIALPASLVPLMVDQRFALQATLSAGLLCPSPTQAPHVDCFSATFFAVGEAGLTGTAASQILAGKLDQLAIAGISPPGLERIIECLLTDLFNSQILPKLTFHIQAFTESFAQLLKNPTLSGSLTINAIPQDPATPIPHDPAIQNDQIQVFLAVT
jgi:hypothetical protein